MQKQFEEIERNMRSILEEINDIGFQFTNFQVHFWPHHNNPLFFHIWDGSNYATNKKGYYSFSIQELAEWITNKKILFQKFNPI